MDVKSRPPRNKQIITLAGAFCALVAICIGVSVVTTNWFMNRGTDWRHDQAHGHAWLHEELGLTDEEADAVDAFEGDYRSQREALLEEFNRRIARLGELLASQDSYSKEVDLAIHQIHEVHGQLQQLSIEHYYDMLRVLPPEKQAMLREVAIRALSQPE